MDEIPAQGGVPFPINGRGYGRNPLTELLEPTMPIQAEDFIKLQQEGARLWNLHLFEEVVKAIYTELVAHNDLVVDGGAHAGLHTLPLAEIVGPKGLVLAFEPLPLLAHRLVEKCQRQGLTQVKVYQQALSVRTSEVSLYWRKKAQALSSLAPPDPSCESDICERLQVQAVRLDDVLGTAYDRHWRFAKLDLEGAEFDALRGARNSLLRYRPALVLEFGYANSARVWGYSQTLWDTFFDGIDYQVYDLLGRPILHRNWQELRPHVWYVIAVPKGSDDETFVDDTLARAIETLVAEWETALRETRLPYIPKRCS